VSEESAREHALTAFLKNRAQAPVEKPGVTIDVDAELIYYNIRGQADDGAFVNGVNEALGQELPLTANKVSRGTHRVYWLGPTEWLVVAEARYPDTGTLLANSLTGAHTAVTDLSGGLIMLTLTGPFARDLLAKGCPLDLHERNFTIEDCAQSVMARASALFALADDSPTFELIVRRSFADYIALWLDRAGQEYDAVYQVA